MINSPSPPHTQNSPRSWATQIFPPYQLLIESYGKAREVEKGHETLDSQRT